MKRAGCVLLAALLCAGLLAGCGSGGAGQGLTDFVSARDKELKKPTREDVSANPTEVETYTDGSFAGVLGFNVVRVASDANVSPTKYFTIDGWFGQIEFLSADGLVLVLRVAREDKKDLTTTYEEDHYATDETRTVDGIEVRTRTAQRGCCMVTWALDGYQFLVHSNAAQGRPPDADIDSVVAGTRCASA